MVLAVTSSIVKNTAPTIARRIAPMFPTWFTNDCAIARSDEVLVSAGELANMRVDLAADALCAVHVVDLDHVPADQPLGLLLRFLEILLVQDDLPRVAALAAGRRWLAP